MKTTYKRETVLDKHSIKSCRACAVKTDMNVVPPVLIQTNQIMRKDFLRKEMLGIAKRFIWSHISCKQGFNGRNSELIDKVGTPKKFYVLQMPFHLMRPKSSKSFIEHTLHVARIQFRTRAL